jgi:hypothetical protein
MVKLYASLLALTLATSSALAYPLTNRIGIVINQRDLDQGFSGREYLLDARDTYHNDDLEERSIFSLFGALGKAASAGKAIKAGSQIAKVAGKARKVHEGAKQILPPTRNQNKGNRVAATFKNIFGSIKSALSRARRHHRRDLEDDEELLGRDDFEADELFEREYDDSLVERDDFDDLD